MKVFNRIYTFLVFLFLYAPILVLLLFSFNSTTSTSVFAGFSLKWYREIFRDHGTLQAFRNTLVLSVLAVVWRLRGQVACPLPAATASAVAAR